MSRDIPGSLHAKEEKELLHGNDGKLLFTRYEGNMGAFLFAGGRLRGAMNLDSLTGIRPGNIYLARVRKKVPNIDACFAELPGGELCYLAMKDCSQASPVNRNPDGRVLEGDLFPVQILREPLKTKQAAATTRLTADIDLQKLLSGCAHRSQPALLYEKQSPLAAAIKAFDGQFQELVTDDPVIFGQLSSMQMPREATFESSQKILQTAQQATKTAVKPIADTDDMQAQVQTMSRQDGTAQTSNISDQLPEQKNHPAIRLYQDASYSLSRLYSLKTRMEEALSPKIWMSSGAYLVLEPTEALTVIDVNSGKYDASAARDSFFEINCEAAKEAALQIRLRNLSGIILIDFINMGDRRQKDELLNLMRELTKEDPVSTRVVDITALGLMEITRKKQYRSLKEQFSKRK